MEIEIVTTKKKLTKSIIKQFELADWKYINFYFTADQSAYLGSLYLIRDVYKFPVVIFKGHNDLWYQFALHEYDISVKGDDCYVNKSRHLFINNKNSAESFIKNVEMIKRNMLKIII